MQNRKLLLDTKSDFFDINSGVRQGDSISLILFIMFMQIGLDLTIRKNNGYEFGGNQALKISISAFADDIVLLTNSFDKIQQNVNTLSNFLAYYNLNLNHKKCGSMNNAHDNRNIYAKNGSERTKLPINKCEHYKYLGVYISMDNRYKKHQQEVKKNYRIVGKLLARKAHLKVKI
jgi:hypothetical protein